MSGNVAATYTGDLSGSTKSILDRMDFTWKIKNFSENINLKSSIQSPIFVLPTSNTEWAVRLYPQGDGDSNSGFISLYLRLLSHEPDFVHIEVNTKFSIVDNQGSLHFTKETEMYKFTKIEGFGFNQYIGTSVLVEKKHLLPDDTLTIKVEGRFSEESGTSPLQVKSDASLPEKGLQKLSSDFKSLYQSRSFSDVILTAGDEEYLLHKCVLSVRSPVLSNLLGSGKKETNCIRLSDAEVPSLGDMISYLYSGRIGDLPLNNAIGLYSLAHDYRIEDLKDICRRHLMENITHENACKILAVAEDRGDSEFQTLTEDYIVKHAIEIFNTMEWKALFKERPSLAVGVLSKSFTKQAESNAR